MVERVAKFMLRHHMLAPGDRLAVAVSGGADSVPLLEILLRLRDRLGITLAVAHFNHRLRGAASDEDERFVAQLAAEKGLPFFLHHSAFSILHNVEAQARQERYAFFATLAMKVATAHTADDQAETVLSRLLRGGATAGLAGIYPVRDGRLGRLIRPLLGERRADVRAWAAGEGLTWREDASNLDLRFLRNRLRHDLLPRLEQEYNPKLVSVLSGAAEIARAEEQFWQRHIESLAARLLRPAGIATSGGLELSLAGFVQLGEAEQRRLLREALRRLRGHLRRIEFRHIEQFRRLALESQSGRQIRLPGCRVIRRREALELALTGKKACPHGSN